MTNTNVICLFVILDETFWSNSWFLLYLSHMIFYLLSALLSYDIWDTKWHTNAHRRPFIMSRQEKSQSVTISRVLVSVKFIRQKHFLQELVFVNWEFRGMWAGETDLTFLLFIDAFWFSLFGRTDDQNNRSWSHINPRNAISWCYISCVGCSEYRLGLMGPLFLTP